MVANINPPRDPAIRPRKVAVPVSRKASLNEKKFSIMYLNIRMGDGKSQR